jgi:hypothetical protein
MKQLFSLIVLSISIGCTQAKTKTNGNTFFNKSHRPNYDTTIKTIHILVALCDNQYQGIVPVPAKIGNGSDKENNLYWGCSFGIRSYFKKSREWILVKTYTVDSIILERVVFKHKTKNYYLIADAYKGKEIKQCTIDFLKSCSGEIKDTITINNKTIGINGNAKLVSYIGHDGLMDFDLDNVFTNEDGKTRDAIILACHSKNYFTKYLQQAKANPLVWTTGLMCPEAYTIHDAISLYIQKKSAVAIQQAAAAAYAKYQKCSMRAASNLLVGGW